MMKSLEAATRIILYLRSNSKERSRKSWLRWRALALTIFSADYSSSEVSHTINRSSGRQERVKSDEDASLYINNLGESKQGAASLIQLLAVS